MKWFKWKEKNGCIAKGEQIGAFGTLYNYINSAMTKFLNYCFINRRQSESYQLDKQVHQIDSTTMMLQMDFAENYTCIAQNEVQSVHWKPKSHYTPQLLGSGIVFYLMLLSVIISNMISMQ